MTENMRTCLQVSTAHLMRHQYHSFLPQSSGNAFSKKFRSGVGVNGAERIVQQVRVRIVVDGTCDLNALLLAPGKVDAPLTNLSFVACT